MVMAIIRWFIHLIWGGQNDLEKNIKEWDRYFEKGRVKKGRRFR
jgi:hypothetical protein|tara:strand:+ start:276 stop:407 length:132 start_codon:yes stop_codon:yes gene_type:complete